MITFERLRLRAVERDDLPHFVAWLNDPEVIHGITVYLPLSLPLEERWYENMLARPPEEHPFVIEVREGEEWTPIGNCSFFHIDWRARHAEVGIVIGEKRLWNQGYGTDAMRFLLHHGFATLNLNRVYLKVYADNPRAIRAYEKAGFVHEGRMRQERYYNGAYYDNLLMSVLRSEWAARPEAHA
jgi:RimJ/RimL family protein N-acetyltransferase